MYFPVSQVISFHNQKILLCCTDTADHPFLETVPFDKSFAWTILLSDHPHLVSLFPRILFGSLFLRPSLIHFSWLSRLKLLVQSHGTLCLYMFLNVIKMCHLDVSNSPLSPKVLLVCSVIYLFGITDPSENLIKAVELPRKMCKISHQLQGTYGPPRGPHLSDLNMGATLSRSPFPSTTPLSLVLASLHSLSPICSLPMPDDSPSSSLWILITARVNLHFPGSCFLGSMK